MTIFLTVNKTGEHKLKSLCIGKLNNPRAFHHVSRQTLPCVYDYRIVLKNWDTQSFGTRPKFLKIRGEFNKFVELGV